MIFHEIGHPFADFIKSKVEERNRKMALKNNMLINVDPDIAAAFDDTNHVSTSKGNGAHLMKIGSKRKRTKAEMRQAREAEAHREQESELRLARIRELEQAMVEKEEDNQRHRGAYDFVKKMVEEGELDLDERGNVQPLQSKMK